MPTFDSRPGYTRNADRRRVRSRGRGVGTSAQGSSNGRRNRARPASTGGRPRLLRRRRRRSTFGRLKFGGPATMVWSGVTLLLGVAALLFQTTAWIAFTLASLGVTVVVRRVEARRDAMGVPAPGKNAPKRPSKVTNAASPRSSGTRPKPKPNGAGAGARRPRKAVCTAACKHAHPRSRCECKAPDCAHGTLHGRLT